MNALPRPKGTKGKAPTEASNATEDKAKAVTINFKISLEFRREIRQLAVDYDLSLVKLLRQSIDAFKASKMASKPDSLKA